MKFKSWKQWRENQTFLEFNGLQGQPDPNGISAPVLHPVNGGPATPMMGTQPGMSMQGGDFKQIYDQFLSYMRQKSPTQQKQVVEQIQKELGLDNPSFGNEHDGNVFRGGEDLNNMLSHMRRF